MVCVARRRWKRRAFREIRGTGERDPADRAAHATWSDARQNAFGRAENADSRCESESGRTRRPHRISSPASQHDALIGPRTTDSTEALDRSTPPGELWL